MLLLALALTAAPPAPCDPATLGPAVDAAMGRLGKRDPAGAKAELGTAGGCPATSYPAFAAHLVRAELAVIDGDWAGVRAALDGVGVHPEVPLSARAGFVRLRADQGLGDAAGFARDRAALIAANDAALARGSGRVETFRAGAATVTAYAAAIDQGPFHRTTEFIIVPDDPNAYPAAIQLTDDRSAVAMAGQMAKPGEAKREHVWFLDQYTCSQHATLAPPIATDDPPAYADLKARVMAVVPTLAAAAPPDRGSCFAAQWILPGLGRRP